MPILLHMTVDRWLHLWDVQDLVSKGEMLTLPITGLYDNQRKDGSEIECKLLLQRTWVGFSPSTHMGGSQLSITPAPGIERCPLLDSDGTACTWCTDKQAKTTHAQPKNKLKKKKSNEGVCAEYLLA